MKDHIETHKFYEFAPALEFMQRERNLGFQAVYFPRGGDTPRKMASDPVEHIVVVLYEELK